MANTQCKYTVQTHSANTQRKHTAQTHTANTQQTNTQQTNTQQTHSKHTANTQQTHSKHTTPRNVLEQEVLHTHDPDTTDAERIQGIIESKYTPADLSKIVEECTHLEKSEQKQFLQLPQKYEDLFDGSHAVCGILGSGEQTRIESCIIQDSRFHGSVTK
jgi:hypothetical protein